MKRLSILGSTGSIGEQTLSLVEAFPDRFRVVALAAGKNIDRLAEQIERFRPVLVSVADDHGADLLHKSLQGLQVKIVVGSSGLIDVSTIDADLVVAGLVGALGLEPVVAAIQAGRKIALANKEVMVTAGALVTRIAEQHSVEILPVDSEHSAIFQAIAGQRRKDISRLVLTASGGPFRTWDAGQIAQASVDDALNHPNWEMGAKITVDSATLMNKGFEVIEARWLFDVPAEQIDVVVHPESIVHSLVEFTDGSVLAQLGLPDMRVPIAVALAHPERLPLENPRLDLTSCGALHFERPDGKRFPALDLAYRALAADEAAPAVLNAANEEAVKAFLSEEISIPEIFLHNQAVLEAWKKTGGSTLENLEDVHVADAWARRVLRERLDHSPRVVSGAFN